ncbi:MAG: hypothetical protein GC154_21360 [bacterium]|nr:hypothetical protein [bacterium]
MFNFNRNSMFIALSFLGCFIAYAQSQSELVDIKQLGLGDLKNSGNVLIRSHQVRLNKNFDNPTWKSAFEDTGGAPILRIETNIVEKISFEKNVYLVSWDETRVYAESAANLNLDDYGEKVVNNIQASKYITPEMTVLKSVFRQGEDTKYWEINTNKDGSLLSSFSTLQTCCIQLYQDFMRPHTAQLFVDPVFAAQGNGVVSELAGSDIKVIGFYRGTMLFSKIYMGSEPEKLISSVMYDESGKMKKCKKVSYSEGKPTKIMEYSFFGNGVEENKINDDDFLFEQATSVFETTILEYKKIGEEEFDVNPFAEMKANDIVIDYVAGTSQRFGDEKTKMYLSEIPKANIARNKNGSSQEFVHEFWFGKVSESMV